MTDLIVYKSNDKQYYIIEPVTENGERFISKYIDEYNEYITMHGIACIACSASSLLELDEVIMLAEDNCVRYDDDKH